MSNLQRTRRRFILRGRGADRVFAGVFLAALLTWCAVAMAAAGTDLYRTKVTVTGQGEANRIVGFAAALEDVLIKASGAQKLSDLPTDFPRRGCVFDRSIFARPFAS